MAKERITHTVDESVSKKFNELTKKGAINKSALIEKMITQWIKKQENEKVDTN